MAKKRIGILTGGGDVPGLNAVIKSVVYGATENGEYDVVGIRRGWMGLTHANLEDGPDPEFTLPLDRENTRRIDRTGGTFLHTSRTKPSRMRVERLPEHVQNRLGSVKEVEPGTVDMTPIVLENLQRLGIDEGEPIRIRQGRGEAVLPAQSDATVPVGAVRIAAASGDVSFVSGIASGGFSAPSRASR